MNTSPNRRHCLYLAVTKNLGVATNNRGQRVRPVKIGITECLGFRSITLNNGYPVGNRRTYRLADCSGWKFLTSTSHVFSEKEATKLESELRAIAINAYGPWEMYIEISGKLKTNADYEGKANGLNGLSELVTLRVGDLSDIKDSLAVFLRKNPNCRDLIKGFAFFDPSLQSSASSQPSPQRCPAICSNNFVDVMSCDKISWRRAMKSQKNVGP